MKTISYVSMTIDLDGNLIQPLNTKTLDVPDDVEYDENGEGVVDGVLIYSPAHDLKECEA